MIDEQQKQVNLAAFEEAANKINALSDAELEALIKEDKCPYPSELVVGLPTGMEHCPLCGEMILLGLPHVRQIPNFTDEEISDLALQSETLKSVG